MGKFATPTFQTPPTKGAKTWQQDVFRTAIRLGTPFMPWQKKATRLLTELSPEFCECHTPPQPLPRFKTVVVSVPRQQGKSALARAAVTTKAEQESDLELFGTAQSRQYAAKHVLSLGKALRGQGVTSHKGVGNEKILWPNGSMYLPISPTEGGGHGDSIDFMLIDEGWALSIETLGGLAPAMIARPHSQMMVISTMGTTESQVWNGIVSEGRDATTDPDETVAYLEYSAPDDEAVFDEDKWHMWMPALGLKVSKNDIRSAIKIILSDPDQGPSEVVRAFGNRTVRTLVTVWPQEWVGAAWQVIEPPEQFVLAVDVNTNPDGATLTTAHRAVDGSIATRLIAYQEGTPHWVPAEVAKIMKARHVEALVGDFSGPARQFKDKLEELCENTGTAFVVRQPQDVGADTAAFYDALREKRVYMEKREPLEVAIAGTRKRAHGDLWVVSRRHMSVDASPIISAVLAHGVAKDLSVNPTVAALIHF